MQVLFFLDNISARGGTERACLSVANLLVERGYEVHLFSVLGNKKEIAYPVDSKIKIHVLGLKRGITLRFQYLFVMSKLLKVIKQNNITHLVGVEVLSGLFVFPLYYFRFLNNKTTKWITWEHFNFEVNLGLKMRDYFRRMAAKHAAAVIVLTEKDKSKWIQSLNPKAAVKSIFNPSPFKISSIPYDVHSKKIISVGRLTHQKGFDRLILIWAEVIKKSDCAKDWKLQIIGDGEDKALIQNLILNHELESFIELIPNTDSIVQHYLNASFLVMSSRFEGLPMVLIEAQSYGLPAVAYDCVTGPSDILLENSGLLAKEGDVDQIADQIIYLMENSEQRQLMSENAKRLALRFSPKSVADDWDFFLKKLN